jgi:hypothetical protein
MALNNSLNEGAPESLDRVAEHNEMREELIEAGFESFGQAAENGLLARNSDGKIVYLRDEGDGYDVFELGESEVNEPLPRSLAIQEAVRRLSA